MLYLGAVKCLVNINCPNHYKNGRQSLDYLPFDFSDIHDPYTCGLAGLLLSKAYQWAAVKGRIIVCNLVVYSWILQKKNRCNNFLPDSPVKACLDLAWV